MTRNITTEIFPAEFKGKKFEVLVVSGTHAEEHGLTVGGECYICGFKPRKGMHTYWVHVSNRKFATEEGLELLPFVGEDGAELFAAEDEAEVSLGWWEIGSECRKRLPEKFVQKKKNKEET